MAASAALPIFLKFSNEPTDVINVECHAFSQRGAAFAIHRVSKVITL
jgi:hypothetical protein